MGGWLLYLLMYVSTQVLYAIIAPGPRDDEPEPASLGDFNIPTIGEGRVLPWFCGTCQFKGPIVTWYGDLQVEKVYEKIKTSWVTSKKVFKCYHYWMGVDLVLCSGEIDEVVELRFEDTVITPNATTVETHGTNLSIDQMEVFGGDTGEGGFSGSVYVWHGTPTQGADPYLESVIGETLPGHRNVCHAVIRGAYVGTSRYLKLPVLVLRRCPNELGLTGGHENIGGDSNAACVAYAILTTPHHRNGLGVPAAQIDTAAWVALGELCYAEGLGLSMLRDSASSSKDLFMEILRHIDAMLFQEPSTGKLTVRAIRQDYDVEDLPVLDETNCEVTSFGRPALRELKNVVSVSYIDREANFTERRTPPIQNLAVIAALGGQVNSQTFSFKGFSNMAIAQLAAARAAPAVSYPLANAHISVTRLAAAMRPGDPFILNYAPLGITGLVMRMLRGRGGTLTKGQVQIEALQDVFGADWTLYATPPQSGWVDPISLPPALADQAGFAAPYEAVKDLSETPGVAYASLLAARGSGGVTTDVLIHREIPGSPGTYYANEDFDELTPSGTLTDAIDESSTEIEVTNGPDIGRVASVSAADFGLGENLAWLIEGSHEEFIAFQTVVAGSGTVTLQTLARGCLDTVPYHFSAGVRIWFVSYGNRIVNMDQPPSSPVTETFRLQPSNRTGVREFSSCEDTEVISTALRRADLYLAPTAVQFNAASYPVSISGELVVSWEHRNARGKWTYAESGATTAAEADTTYTIQVYGEGGGLIHTEVVAGTDPATWTYLEALEISEGGLGRLNTQLRVVLSTAGSAYGGHAALCVIDWTFARA